MIVALVGPSGSGKTEFCMACERLGIKRVITNTTRERRVSDKPDAYHFRTLEEFKKLIEQDFLLEYTQYNGNYYGITEDSIKDPCVVVVEPEGYFELRDTYEDNLFMVYLEVTDKERIRRTINRGDKVEVVNSRVEEDKYVFTDGLKDEADLVLTNITLEEIPQIVNEYKQKWLRRG